MNKVTEEYFLKDANELFHCFRNKIKDFYINHNQDYKETSMYEHELMVSLICAIVKATVKEDHIGSYLDFIINEVKENVKNIKLSEPTISH